VGPDTEDDENWITTTGMAGRITVNAAPQEMLETLPDPRDFVYQVGPGTARSL
jgi:hypothetical protein